MNGIDVDICNRDLTCHFYPAADRPIHNQRRLAISGPEVSLGCVSMPRMVRRGAISYNETDATAQYIRFLGKRIHFYYAEMEL